MHQIFAELFPFESFHKLFATYCLEVIVLWSYGQDIDFFFFFQHLLLLDLQGNLTLLNLYKYIY